MGYVDRTELAFAHGFYKIDGKGVVHFADNTPDEIIHKFWRIWPLFHKKVVALEKKGVFTSEYPVLPFDDPIENVKRYEMEE